MLDGNEQKAICRGRGKAGQVKCSGVEGVNEATPGRGRETGDSQGNGSWQEIGKRWRKDRGNRGARNV